MIPTNKHPTMEKKSDNALKLEIEQLKVDINLLGQKSYKNNCLDKIHIELLSLLYKENMSGEDFEKICHRLNNIFRQYRDDFKDPIINIETNITNPYLISTYVNATPLEST